MTNETHPSPDPTGPLVTDPMVQDRLLAETSRRIALVLAVAWLSFAVLHLIAGRVWVLAVHVTVSVLSALLTFSVDRWPRGALHVLTAISMLGLVLVAAMTGGASSPGTAFVGLVALMASLLEHRGARYAWLAAAVVGVLAVTPLRAIVPDESLAMSPLENALTPVGLGLVVFLLGTVWRRASTDQVALLEKRRAKIEKQASTLAEQRTELGSAREQAERASAQKSRFVAMTAHELRGPLNGVLGMAHVLADTKLSAHQADLVASIRTSAEGLNKVLQDLLDLSKIEAGKVDITRAPYEPRELCADVLDGIAAAAVDKGLSLGWLATARVPHLASEDAGRLRQVLGNLATNAVKFTTSGEVRIEVDLVGEGDAQRLVYAVKDTGKGIEPEHVERIFAPFEQVSDELLDRRAGTGLGLWISRSFVEAMGGRLRVESVPRRGSAFYVELPYVSARGTLDARVVLPGRPHIVIEARTPAERDTARSVAHQLEADVTVIDGIDAAQAAIRPETRLVVLEPERIAALRSLRIPDQVGLALAAWGRQVSAAEALVAAIGRPASLLLKPLRATRLAVLFGQIDVDEGTPAPMVPEEVVGTLLVVDDDAINRKVVRFAAGRFGYRVVEAGSGEEALEILERRPVDVVLLDLHMAGMDGVETAVAITKRYAPAMRPSLLGHTGTVNETDRARCLTAGMEEVLAKPLEQPELGAALSRARRQRARRRLSGSIASVDALPVLHDETLTKFLKGMGSEGAELARSFATELPERVLRVQTACRAADRPLLKREAHTLAAAAATFGGARLTLACRRIESNADSEPFATLEARVAEVETRATELVPALARAVPDLAASI